MSNYQSEYLKYKKRYLNSKLQIGGSSNYEPDKSRVINIEEETVSNQDYRRVIYTSDFSQLVLMTLKPGVEIGMELHEDVDQFIRIEKGYARYSKNGERKDYGEETEKNQVDQRNRNIIYDKEMKPTAIVVNNEVGELPQDHVLLVPHNTWHNVWNPVDATEDVHIYTLYSFAKQNPPHKKDMATQHEKKDEPFEQH